jgi:hypothetical protein
MIPPVSSASAATKVSAAQNNPAPKTPARASQPKDSVHLSAAAKAASSDADHDGDSH